MLRETHHLCGPPVYAVTLLGALHKLALVISNVIHIQYMFRTRSFIALSKTCSKYNDFLCVWCLFYIAGPLTVNFLLFFYYVAPVQSHSISKRLYVIEINEMVYFTEHCKIRVSFIQNSLLLAQIKLSLYLKQLMCYFQGYQIFKT